MFAVAILFVLLPTIAVLLGVIKIALVIKRTIFN